MNASASRQPIPNSAGVAHAHPSGALRSRPLSDAERLALAGLVNGDAPLNSPREKGRRRLSSV